MFNDELDNYKCPTCGKSNENCRCDDDMDYDFDFGYWDGGYPYDDDDYFDIYEANLDEDLEIICEFNGKQLTRAEAIELWG